MEGKIVITSTEWRELQNVPAFKAFLSIIRDRLEIKRDSLEAGLETTDENHVVIMPFEDIRFIQGECKSLRYIEVLLSGQERLTKELEKLEAERKKKNESKGR
jgi:hypothetical protein